MGQAVPRLGKRGDRDTPGAGNVRVPARHPEGCRGKVAALAPAGRCGEYAFWPLTPVRVYCHFLLMKTLFILDADSRSALSESLRTRVTEIARAKRHDVGVIELGRSDSPPCTGCFRCLMRPAEACVSRGFFARIIQQAPEYQVIIFLTPVIFGTYSSTIKNVVDRGGLVITHHARCRQIIIGYAENATEEERSTFIDVTMRHRGKADIVHPNLVEDVRVYFTRSPADNESVCESLGAIV